MSSMLGLAAFSASPLNQCFAFGSVGNDLLTLPDWIEIQSESEVLTLEKLADNKWGFENTLVSIAPAGDMLNVKVTSPSETLCRIYLRWKQSTPAETLLLGDHWERGYGDLEWAKTAPDKPMPWYFMLHLDGKTSGYGVKTQPSAICFWNCSKDQITLICDVRNGGSGVQLGSRELSVCSIVSIRSKPDETPYQTVTRFCSKMCDRPRLPEKPVYGINDWYYAYGRNSASGILADAMIMSEMITNPANPPFCVIDAGWAVRHLQIQESCCAETYLESNDYFGDMPALADKITKTGFLPGLWTRPLCPGSKIPDSRLLVKPQVKAFDPTIDENLAYVASLFKTYKAWGYKLVKHDFTTWDIWGRWGKDFASDITDPGWHFNNKSLTTAEVIVNLYRTIMNAAPELLLLGCNTVSHLSAGIHHIQRIGDDTSGTEWARTKKMGVNTLAFRACQHQTFYSGDADCVGLTDKIPWHLIVQWLQLLAQSGTPLFVSADIAVLGKAQKHALKEAFDTASKPLVTAEALDWFETKTPAKWKLNNKIVTFQWD